MSDKPLVLLVEDNVSLAMAYQEYLSAEDILLEYTDSGEHALQFIEEHLPSVVLLDVKLPDMDGMQILQTIQERKWPVAVIMITAYATVDMAVDAMNYGAFDFLEKPFDAKRLRVTVVNALKRLRLQHS